ncbi:hypothetical protein [Mycobacterium tuberculosis]|uniref:hypothetical protein n=1 Tax=Mycobacterium tuberculosis TaxID=1773 RepID=UPI00272B09D1|nr:hypothetical protein [Mycobacterium tuberculosis]
MGLLLLVLIGLVLVYRKMTVDNSAELAQFEEIQIKKKGSNEEEMMEGGITTARWYPGLTGELEPNTAVFIEGCDRIGWA